MTAQETVTENVTESSNLSNPDNIPVRENTATNHKQSIQHSLESSTQPNIVPEQEISLSYVEDITDRKYIPTAGEDFRLDLNDIVSNFTEPTKAKMDEINHLLDTTFDGLNFST